MEDPERKRIRATVGSMKRLLQAPVKTKEQLKEEEEKKRDQKMK